MNEENYNLPEFVSSSDFLMACSGKDIAKTFSVINNFMDRVRVFSPTEYAKLCEEISREY